MWIQLQKIWKDPVWSKVISVAIISALTLIYNLILSQKEDSSFKAIFLELWTHKVELWIIALLILLIVFVNLTLNNAFQYTEETLSFDRNLFNRIRNWDGMTNLVMEIKTHGFSGRPVKMDRFETMIDIMEASNEPDFEFFNPKMNKVKNKLFEEFENLNSVLNKFIFGANNGFVSIPREWEYQQPDRMEEAFEKIKSQEEKFTEAYQNFISKGRRTLKI